MYFVLVQLPVQSSCQHGGLNQSAVNMFLAGINHHPNLFWMQFMMSDKCGSETE